MSTVVIALLQLLQEAHAKSQVVTREEMIGLLIEKVDGRSPRFPYDYYYWWEDFRHLPSPLQSDLVDNALAALTQLGLVARDDHRADHDGRLAWKVADSWQPPHPPHDGDGGSGGGNESIPGGDGDGDGDGGGGLRETLGHPILFALPGEDFDELVEGLFAGELE